MTDGARDEPSRLARRLGLFDAVVIGLGSMIGAGVFAALGPAAAAAGGGLLVGLAVAAVVAYCNATSSAQLAAVYPESGGTYVYGRERLGPFWGYLAGWGFVVGKTASGAAMALTFGTYAAPEWRRPLAVAAVVVLTSVNYRGVRKTARLTQVIVVIVLATLAVVVVAALFGGEAAVARIGPVTGGGAAGILESAGLLFFAFAGYARIATLGEEVVDPARTIPRAIPLALGVTLVVYATVAVAALLAVGPDRLANAPAPLAEAVRSGSLGALAPAVRVGGTVAALGVLVSLIVGVSRTAFAMAADRELPGWLDAVHPVHRVPHRAELAVGALVTALVLVADLRGAIGFSSFAVLTYYAIANASAWTLPPEQRRWPRPLAGLGLVGCAVLAVTLPAESVLTGVGVLGVGAAVWLLRRVRHSRAAPPDA
ncbi:APC family permease [Iamia sp.]|uniref:APC family permease n=1 Tax=Iamia sp. TaxID=2722710 RepID=UPI002BF15E67|nr:APC family permease [Iamia sp.]HXH56518.1 APC family permease [Iamia sp.]